MPYAWPLRKLWVGTQNGLNRFDPHAGEFAIFNEHDGLPATR